MTIVGAALRTSGRFMVMVRSAHRGETAGSGSASHMSRSPYRPPATGKVAPVMRRRRRTTGTKIAAATSAGFPGVPSACVSRRLQPFGVAGLGVNVGLDQAGADAIDPDAILRDLGAEAVGEGSRRPPWPRHRARVHQDCRFRAAIDDTFTMDPPRPPKRVERHRIARGNTAWCRRC